MRLRGDGLRPTRALYRRDDAVDPRADVPRFELGFVAEREGRARLTGDCTFYVCQSDRCRPVAGAAGARPAPRSTRGLRYLRRRGNG